jgi:integrase
MGILPMSGDRPIRQGRSATGVRLSVLYPHFTHHDLRHFFATTCIESGVDIPTVSRWLGHKDGGALAMRVYGHLRQEHSTVMIKEVSF